MLWCQGSNDDDKVPDDDDDVFMAKPTNNKSSTVKDSYNVFDTADDSLKKVIFFVKCKNYFNKSYF